MALSALGEAGLAPASVRAVATIDRRLEHPAARHLAQRLRTELVGFTADELDSVPVPNGSSRVQAAVGTTSVAEAAALLGSGGRLLLPKRAGRSVTIAVAERVE